MLAAVSALLAAAVLVFAQGPPPNSSPKVDLGFRLFKDARFSSPQGDLQNSCSSCHLLDEDPQGVRIHTDFFARSWVPYRREDPRRDGLRNSPTIFDAALMPKLHFDGEFNSLESLVKSTLAGRPMGWLPGEQEQAFNRIHGIILADAGEGADGKVGYRAEFKSAYGIDPQTLRKAEVIDAAVNAISEYIRTQRTQRTTAYDRFVQANGLDASPATGEHAKVFAVRLLGKIDKLERDGALKLPRGFDRPALTGMKIFFSTSGDASVGNCVACHTPPLFTDFSFHNMGISQSEYDQVNGEGAFAGLHIPDAAGAVRPSVEFRETPSRHRRGWVDLGHWNFVDLKSSTLRRSGETDNQFLARMIGTFKTPTLRNLAFSFPYMHTGGFSTVESAVAELMRLSEKARRGQVREGDEELAGIRIREADIASLAAFLKTLNQDFKPARK